MANEQEKKNDEESFKDYENPNYRKLYATLSVTAMMGSNTDEEGTVSNNEAILAKKSDSELPSGWEKHEDDEGPYYWHIASGVIQRRIPTENISKSDSIFYYEGDGLEKLSELMEKRMNLSENFSVEDKVFTVNSLGWMEFDESQLTPELSSRAIKQCILELTTQSEHAVRCWGKQETKRLILKVEDRCLKLLDPISGTVLTTQPIATIRVWGVNESDDFAYVARDTNFIDEDASEKDSLLPCEEKLPILKCHVFHCESDTDSGVSAQRIANLLKEEMIRIKSMPNTSGSPATRPNHLDIDTVGSQKMDSPGLEFPTPIEEPRKTIVARYLGKTMVAKPTGVNILNEAIDQIAYESERSSSEGVSDKDDGRGMVVLVHISPSKVSVESTVNGETLVDCRVRYLSFMGISRNNVKICGFIVQIDEKTFEAHGFQCEPSAGALCKTIEAACKLRYQKCLDAHRQRCSQSLDGKKNQSQAKRSSSMSAIKSSLMNTFSKFLKG